MPLKHTFWIIAAGKLSRVQSVSQLIDAAEAQFIHRRCNFIRLFGR